MGGNPFGSPGGGWESEVAITRRRPSSSPSSMARKNAGASWLKDLQDSPGGGGRASTLAASFKPEQASGKSATSAALDRRLVRPARIARRRHSRPGPGGGACAGANGE